MIRQPIVSVLGHVDHGKTTLLDKIRGSAVAEREAGGITQHIGATEIPTKVIEELCGGLLKQLKAKIGFDGLLFIDTPGHAAFTTLRKRGGALADIAILIVDLTEGFQPQTFEAINILRTYKTPFLIAANKVDKVRGWQVFPGYPFSHSFSKQSDGVKTFIEERIYTLVGKLYEEGFQADRFDRVEKFEKQIAIVPISAKTGEGIPELLMILIGLAQKFLEKRLEIEVDGPAKGTVLEVREEVGLGTTIDVIIYDGKIKRGNEIVVGGHGGVINTKVRSLLKPRPLDEIRDPKHKFEGIQEVHAASGIKISAPNLQDVVAGSPIRVVDGDIDKVKKEVQAEIEEVRVETETTGVIVKADTLGALEALVKMLEEAKVPIKRADVGDISRRDITEAETAKKDAPIRAAVLGFNVKIKRDAEEKAHEAGVSVFMNNVIYKLLEDYKEWVQEEIEKEKKMDLVKLTRPAKIKFLPDHVFRRSKPVVVGVEVMLGILKNNSGLINKEGKRIGTVEGMQDKGEKIKAANMGMQVAVSIDGPTVGRHINEGDILYTDINENEARLLEVKYKNSLNSDEREALEEIKTIKRKDDIFWASASGGT
ncbi:translation initiation factor IF-2 [archaeon]|nr:translation initiation factor IF-2 [archaeon]